MLDERTRWPFRGEAQSCCTTDQEVNGGPLERSLLKFGGGIEMDDGSDFLSGNGQKSIKLEARKVAENASVELFETSVKTKSELCSNICSLPRSGIEANVYIYWRYFALLFGLSLALIPPVRPALYPELFFRLNYPIRGLLPSDPSSLSF